MMNPRQPSSFKAQFEERIRTLRKQRGLTQEHLAIDADTSMSEISRIERGVINTGLLHIIKIAGALGMQPKDLLDFDSTN